MTEKQIDDLAAGMRKVTDDCLKKYNLGLLECALVEELVKRATHQSVSEINVMGTLGIANNPIAVYKAYTECTHSLLKMGEEFFGDK